MASLQARAEGLIMRGLTHHLLARNIITRVGPDELFHEGEADGIDRQTWDRALYNLIGTGLILEYKYTDLPGTLPIQAFQTGYTTPEHLLGVLKKAMAHQVEELRNFLEDAGVEIPSSATRVLVTAGQKKRIDSAVRKLNEIRNEVADRNPENTVAWYLDAAGNLNMMVEPKGQMEPDQQYIAHKIKLCSSGGGDW